MNFFGGSGCGDVGRDCGCGNDCGSLIFLIFLLNCCGGGMKGINVDCGTILLLLLLSNCNFCK